MNCVTAGTRHTGQLHLTSHASEFIISVHTTPRIHSTQKRLHQSGDLAWHCRFNSPREALTTLGITGGWACCPLQTAQQIALGASHAGSYTCICTELPFFTQNADTFTTVSETTVLRMMHNLVLKSTSELMEAKRLGKWRRRCNVSPLRAAPLGHTQDMQHKCH